MSEEKKKPRHKWETYRTCEGRGAISKRCKICGLAGTLSILKKANLPCNDQP